MKSASTMRTLALLLIAILALSDSATACRIEHTMTLLRTLPDAARSEPVVAAVEAIELLPPSLARKEDDGWGSSPLVRVRVVEAINGVQEGQILVVDAIGSSCDQVFRRSEAYFRSYLTKRHYIAGKLEANGNGDIVFHGAWVPGGAAGELIPVRRAK